MSYNYMHVCWHCKDETLSISYKGSRPYWEWHGWHGEWGNFYSSLRDSPGHNTFVLRAFLIRFWWLIYSAFCLSYSDHALVKCSSVQLINGAFVIMLDFGSLLPNMDCMNSGLLCVYNITDFFFADALFPAEDFEFARWDTRILWPWIHRGKGSSVTQTLQRSQIEFLY